MPNPFSLPVTLRKFVHLALSIGALLAAGTLPAQTIIHVTPSQGALQDAINTIPEGGIIELSGGTYNAPNGGFTIYQDLNGGTKSFTIRAATGATPVLSGNGSTDILRFTTPKPVTFQGLTFANGSSASDYIGGAITMGGVQAHFVSCTFENNAQNAAVAGGSLRIDTSTVSFHSCSWNNNKSATYGAAFSSFNSRVFVRESRFVGNRINLSGHSAFSAGGAIHANGGSLRIANSRFENNQAGYVGGAIYAYGPWTDPNDVAVMDVVISDSLFIDNASIASTGTTQTAPTAGGAVTLEDQTTAHFYNCRFTNNSAKQGGAISSYRTITEIQNSVFRNNEATGNSGSDGFGGSIIILSDDNPDASTQGGARNRPTAKLTVTDSLFQGRGSGAPSARQGGAIFVAGDTHSNFGIAMPRNGTDDSNRMAVNLTRVVFADLATADSGTGTGGALTGDFIALNAEKCIIQNCGSTHFGGGIELVRHSKATISTTTFANNSTGLLGGALTMFGGTLNITASNFLNNRITGQGAGSTIMTAPDTGGGGVPALDMTGTIQNCVLNTDPTAAYSIYDGDSYVNGPYNRLQYGTNQIYPANSSAFYTDILGAFAVPQMNTLVRNRADGSAATVKAPVANVALGSPGTAGALLIVPTRVLSSGAPGETLPIPATLSFAAGGGPISLDGSSQTSNTGMVNTTVDTQHVLTTGTLQSVTTPLPATALNISTRLPVGGNDRVLIGGFIVVGPTPKRVLIRALGPSLPVTGTLQDPNLQLYRGATLIARNDNWRSTQIAEDLTSSQVIDILATNIPPLNDAESAIVATLNPGAYTAVVQGANTTTGIALVEVYDLDPVQNSTLANISTRGFIQGGDNVMIGGFIYLGGPGATKVVIRGIGPSLGAFGVANPLADPFLELHDSNGAMVASNDNAANSPDLAAIQAAGLQPSNPAESAIYKTGLPRGAYTAIVRGNNNGTGVGVVEAYIFQ